MWYNERMIIDLKRIIKTYEDESKYMSEEEKCMVVSYIVALRALVKKYEVNENV